MFNRHQLSSRVAGFFGAFGSAIAAASATEAGRQPRACDLRKLGIDPEQYGRIGR